MRFTHTLITFCGQRGERRASLPPPHQPPPTPRFQQEGTRHLSQRRHLSPITHTQLSLLVLPRSVSLLSVPLPLSHCTILFAWGHASLNTKTFFFYAEMCFQVIYGYIYVYIYTSVSSFFIFISAGLSLQLASRLSVWCSRSCLHVYIISQKHNY